MGKSLFEFEEEEGMHRARIKVVGVGGAGGNAVNRMIDSKLSGVEFIVANTDAQVLTLSQAQRKVQLGLRLTKGLGTGANPETGRKAAEESRDELAEALAGADMVFIAAGEGKGTGTGASPIVAEVAKELGCLTVGIVTKPFLNEGRKRARIAEEGIAALRDKVDTLIVIPNERLLALVEKRTPLEESLRMVDDVLFKATKGISDLITVAGIVNVDFADVKSVMSEVGDALMGTGSATGDNRASEAAAMAIACPLLEDISISGARGLLVNITGGPDLSLTEANEVKGIVLGAAGQDANLIWGAVVDKAREGELWVTVIATGIGSPQRQKEDIPEIAAKTIPFSQFKDRELTKVPAYVRKAQMTNENTIVTKGQVTTVREDDLEVPTFLRRQMD
jgi:cell division protein FtsZ